MAKPPKLTPEELAERRERDREFRAMLERRLEIDRRLRAEREARERGEKR